ncbi:MAG: hypothetical protein GWO24_00915, partial [Akkermansiaceae bacterium]|nr:hypothetical protein [Akkermansiaceae bacterium]
VLMHLLVADMMMRDSGSRQLIDVIGKSLKGGRLSFLVWVFFSGVFFAFVTTLAAYIAGGGHVVADLLSLPDWTGSVLFYLLAAGVVAFGLKAVGVSEKLAIIGIACLMLV